MKKQYCVNLKAFGVVYEYYLLVPKRLPLDTKVLVIQKLDSMYKIQIGVIQLTRNFILQTHGCKYVPLVKIKEKYVIGRFGNIFMSSTASRVNFSLFS